MKHLRRLFVVSIMVVAATLLAVTVVLAQDGANNETAEYGTQSQVASSGGPVCGGTGGSVGIIHDDGTFENGYAGNPASVTIFQNVDLFNPVGPSYSYTRFCVGLVSLAGPNLNFEIVFYDNNGTGGAPGTELAAVPASASNIPNSLPCGWYEYDLTNASGLPTGADGDVYIGVRYNPATYPSVYTCADESATTPLWTGYAQFNTGGWSTTQSYFPNFRAMSHRVEMTAQLLPAITFTKTVGTDPGACATTSNISVGYGSTVYYCYTVTNTGNVTLTGHTLTDDVLGTVLGPDFAYNLAPSASAFVTASYVLTGTSVTNTALWEASINSTVVATATASATVTGTPTDVTISGVGGQTTSNGVVLAAAVVVIFVMGAALYLRRQHN